MTGSVKISVDGDKVVVKVESLPMDVFVLTGLLEVAKEGVPALVRQARGRIVVPPPGVGISEPSGGWRGA